MIEFILELDKKVLATVIGAVLASFFMVVGYFYRVAAESKKNRKLALYILLKIWHKLAIFHIGNVDRLFDKIFQEMREEFPEHDIPESEVKEAKRLIGPVIEAKLNEEAMADIENLESQFLEAVKLLSEVDPLYAYKLSSAGKIKSHLSWLDSYNDKVIDLYGEHTGISLNNKLNPLKKYISSKQQIESANEVESFIKSLSLKVSLVTFIVCLVVMWRRKNKLRGLAFKKKEIKDLLRNGIKPVVDGSSTL